MPENTDHPTQKSEKLVAKLMLASTNPGDLVLDPFLGSGTTSVVAKKLGRHFIGVELDEEYALLAQKRLELADQEGGVQGYSGGVFWERNSLNAMNGSAKRAEKADDETRLLI
jgi:site-specific DNA-methyltransferase (adenine-specific)